jgi:hypothetical protein
MTPDLTDVYEARNLAEEFLEEHAPEAVSILKGALAEFIMRIGERLETEEDELRSDLEDASEARDRAESERDELQRECDELRERARNG